MPITLPDQYAYVLLSGSMLAFELLVIGFVFPGKARSKAFTKKFMEQNFLEEHQAALGNRDVPKNGYPDTGSGRYASKLGYKEWFDLNNAQRAHYNFLEMAPSTFVWLFIAGLVYPKAAAILGGLTGLSRLIYSIGYTSKGPKGRSFGAIANDLCILGLFGLSLAAGYKLLK